MARTPRSSDRRKPPPECADGGFVRSGGLGYPCQQATAATVGDASASLMMSAMDQSAWKR